MHTRWPRYKLNEHVAYHVGQAQQQKSARDTLPLINFTLLVSYPSMRSSKILQEEHRDHHRWIKDSLTWSSDNKIKLMFARSNLFLLIQVLSCFVLLLEKGVPRVQNFYDLCHLP